MGENSPQHCSGQELCVLFVPSLPSILNFDANLLRKIEALFSLSSRVILTFKNGLFRYVKKLNSFLNNAAFTAIYFNSCGHIENMGDTFSLKEGKVCSYILAGEGGKEIKTFQGGG